MLFIRSEYSFKKVFYPLETAIKDAKDAGHTSVCIIDDTTFGYVKFERLCEEHKINAIYGLSVIVTDISVKSRSIHETCNESDPQILIAKSRQGVIDLYTLYSKSIERYNRYNRLIPEDFMGQDIIRIGRNFKYDIHMDDLCTYTAKHSVDSSKSVYQCITGSRGISAVPDDLMTFDYRNNIITKGMLYFDLPKAKMISYNGILDFSALCKQGLLEKGFWENQIYQDRMAYEIEMIKSKDFQDYFMIVADMISKAKETMLVGPGRGSSGGSLVCYVLGITNLDPIEHGLIFERFIDVNRNDYPDIDTDYPDVDRMRVIEDTKKKYRSVFRLSTISGYSPKTILNDFAKEYKIPPYEIKELKDSIIERSSGDARAKSCLQDTLKGDVGKQFLEKYPEMADVYEAEGHARHHGTHAAGIIVLDEDIHQYGATDSENDIVYLEGKDAESLGLLKIDCLGLRTLSIIQNCLALSGVSHMDMYDIPLDDPAVLEVFNGGDLTDIFQFDGDAIGMVCNRLTVDKFTDLVAITSLGRPGALNSGGTDKYIRINEGEKEATYYGDLYKKITFSTHGIVVYQEQTMVLLREFGGLSWEDVNLMRRIISKSRGDEFFNKYKAKFIIGAMENGHTEDTAEIVWDAIASMGSYAFNKSHAVAYAMISYWCAYCKHNYPLNFLAANLNNAKDDDHALKLLRKYVKSHDIEYVPVDPDISAVGWTIQKGRLIGGLTNIKGIAEKKAKDLIARRDGTSKKALTKTMIKTLMNPVTKFDELYPLTTKYKRIYERFDITKIEDIKPKVKMTTIGKLTLKDLRDRNDVQSVIKRGHRLEEQTHYLNLVIEDDTGVIKANVAPFDMEDLDGMKLADTLAIGDVLAVNGTVREGWSSIGIKGIKKVEDI